MTATNNSLNLPLSDGQIIIGVTGDKPVVANVTGATGGSITVTNGPGSIALSTMSLSTVTLNTTLASNKSYSIRDVLTLVIFTLPATTAKKGDTYEIYACGLSNFGFQVNTTGSQLIYGPVSNSPQNNIRFVVTGQPSAVKIRCIDDTIVNSEIFQVVSHEGTPSTAP